MVNTSLFREMDFLQVLPITLFPSTATTVSLQLQATTKFSVRSHLRIILSQLFLRLILRHKLMDIFRVLESNTPDIHFLMESALYLTLLVHTEESRIRLLWEHPKKWATELT